MTNLPAIKEKEPVTLRQYLRSEQMLSRFADVVGKGNAGAYIQSALLAVANNDALQKCSMPSIAVSALRAATLRLSCDPGVGEAYLVPFAGHAALIIGYKGLKTMAIRTNRYRFLHVANIFEGQVVAEDQMRGTHKITGNKDSEKVIGRLAYFEMMTGFAKSLYMTTEEIHAHARRYSKSYNKKGSVWSEFEPGDPDHPMEKKTPFRLLIQRWGVLDPLDRQAIDSLNEEIVDGEMVPMPEDVDIKDEPHRPVGQNMKDLGFGDETYRYNDAQIIARIAKAKGMEPAEMASTLISLHASGEVPDEMTLKQADELAARLPA